MALSGRSVAACRSSEASVHSWKRGIWMAADLVRVRVRVRVRVTVTVTVMVTVMVLV